VDGLALKLVLTPTLIGVVSLAGRRWGPGVSGWLVGFPLTSGPVALFLALAQGVTRTSRNLLIGTLLFFGLGLTSYVRSSEVPLIDGVPESVTRAGSVRARERGAPARDPDAAPLLALVAVPWSSRAFFPAESPHPARRPRWDIPARIVVTTTIVLVLTGLATALGPSLTGLLATYPLYGAILSGFAHHLEGPGPAVRVLRGLLLGLFAFAGFFFVLALLIERAGIAQAFAAAIAAALVLQAGALWAMRRDSPA
jgi:hypothetical protein